MRRFMMLAALLVLPGCLQDSAPTRVSREMEPLLPLAHQRNKIEWPGPGAPGTLQETLDEAPPGSVVEIKPGVYRITPLFVQYKDLTIKGAGAGSGPVGSDKVTHLIGPAPDPIVVDEGVAFPAAETVEGGFNFMAANVAIQDLMISGFNAGIVIKDDREHTPVTVELKDLVIANTGRGVLSLSTATLFATDVDIGPTLWNGISLSAPQISSLPDAHALIKSGSILNPAGAGMYFHNTQATVEDQLVNFANGGILGSLSSLIIRDCRIKDNRKAGIFLYQCTFLITRNIIQRTFPTLEGFFGDGMLLMASHGSALTNFIGNSARAGLSNFGGIVTLRDNTFCVAAFELEGEPYNSVPFTFIDASQNDCDCGNIPLVSCVAISVNIQPPAPISNGQ